MDSSKTRSIISKQRSTKSVNNHIRVSVASMNGSTVKQLFVIALIEQQRHFAYNKNKSNNNCRKFFGEVVNRKYKRKPTRGFVQVKVCVNNKAVSIFVSKKNLRTW